MKAITKKMRTPIPCPIERRIDDLGRVVIPKEIRAKLGIKAGDSLDIYLCRDGIYIEKQQGELDE